jgi:murein DD-endopeptidase MepM/ murein hydrolase activator NlpD
MTPRKKSKLNTLHPKHPYRIQYEKSIQKSGKDRIAKDFKNGTHTYSFVLLAGLSAVGLIMFVPPLSHIEPPPVVTSSPDSASMVDLLNGMGGPEDVPERQITALEEIALEFEESVPRFEIASQPLEGPTVTVTITKIYNHLKVSNTVMPTTSPEITSDYGWRTPPCSGCSADHKGVDFVPGYGEPIFAVADGMVIEMGGDGGYGNYVKLKHLIGNSEGVIEEWVTLYAHMKNDSFPEGMIIGTVVKSGDTIGAVGNTGMSTGPHLHFELTINGEHVDPLPLLGTYEVIIVSEEDHPDYMFVGETFKKVETVVGYE